MLAPCPRNYATPSNLVCNIPYKEKDDSVELITITQYPLRKPNDSGQSVRLLVSNTQLMSAGAIDGQLTIPLLRGHVWKRHDKSEAGIH